MRSTLAIVAMMMSTAPAMAEDLDDATKAYMARVLTEQGFAQDEFKIAAEAYPLFAAYILGSAAASDCALPTPSQNLFGAADGDRFIKTPEGKKVFIVGAAVASLKKTASEQKRFCDDTRHLVEEAERLAAKQ